jgi:hypothetical protein
MANTDEAVKQLLARRPFAVLGYSAEDAVWCPACLRSAAGLSPGRPDTCGQPIVPLYARDSAVREKICENCERSLYDLLAARDGTTEPKPVTAQLRVHGKRSSLEFARVPPIEVRTALKSTGWRWDPRLRVWWTGEEVPRVPAQVVPPTPESHRCAVAKTPTVRPRR